MQVTVQSGAWVRAHPRGDAQTCQMCTLTPRSPESPFKTHRTSTRGQEPNKAHLRCTARHVAPSLPLYAVASSPLPAIPFNSSTEEGMNYTSTPECSNGGRRGKRMEGRRGNESGGWRVRSATRRRKAAAVTINSNVLLSSLRSDMRCVREERWTREHRHRSLSLIFLNEDEKR